MNPAGISGNAVQNHSQTPLSVVCKPNDLGRLEQVTTAIFAGSQAANSVPVEDARRLDFQPVSRLGRLELSVQLVDKSPMGVPDGVSSPPPKAPDGIPGSGTAIAKGATLTVDPDFTSATEFNQLTDRQKYYLNALTLNQTNALAWYNLGTTIAKGTALPVDLALRPATGVNQLTRQKCYLKALSLDNKCSFAWKALGSTIGMKTTLPVDPDFRLAIGFDHLTAQQCCLKYLTLGNKCALVWYNLGITIGRKFTLLVDPDVASAIGFNQLTDGFNQLTDQKCYLNALTLNNEYTLAWTNLGATIANGDTLPVDPDFALAIGFNQLTKQECYLKALTLDQTDVFAWTNLGIAIANGATLPEDTQLTAQECYLKALTLNNKYARAWGELGIAIANGQTVIINNIPYTNEQCLRKALSLDRGNLRYAESLYSLMKETSGTVLDSFIPPKDQNKRSINLKAFQNSLKSISTKYKDLPPFDFPAFQLIITEFVESQKVMSPLERDEIRRDLGDLSKVRDLSIDNSENYFKELLTPPQDNSEVASILKVKLHESLDYLQRLKNKPDKKEEFSSELRLFLINVLTYKEGKQEGIRVFHNYLRAKGEKNLSLQADTSITAEIEAIMATQMERLFTQESEFIRNVTGVNPEQPIVQAAHQLSYVRNLIASIVGLPHELDFDPAFELVYPALQDKTREEILSTFYSQFFTPELLVRSLQRAVADRLCNAQEPYEIIRPYIVFLEERQPDLVVCERDKDTGDLIGLTEEAALSVLGASGYIIW